MIKVDHLNNSRSQRVLWLLEELNEPYEVVRYQRDKLTMRAPDQLKRVHPLGKSPVIAAIHQLFPWLRHLFADSVHNGANLHAALTKFGH
jgi:transposase